jgi:hypothetical protein
MGLSIRRIFIAKDGEIYRISNTKFARMMRDPACERIALFAGQRVRSAELLIEIFERKPYCVHRATYTIFQFDDHGYVDVDRYDTQQVALVNIAIAPVLGIKKSTKNIVDASDQFVAQGGSWSPTGHLKNQIEKVGLGQLSCPAL